MLHYRLMFLKLAVAALLLSLVSSANAEWKTSYATQGNNVGMVLTLGWGGPLGRGIKQFPRGSGNLYTVANWCFGVCTARDCDGNGTAEDTTAPLSRGAECAQPMRGTLEALDQLTAFHAAGERMDEASARISFNRVWASLDADDLPEWPAEFRTGRTSSGDPILHGAETAVAIVGDAFSPDGAPVGIDMEWQCYFLNFAESNNMMYFHVFLRNMSEYLKWNFDPDMAAKTANTPDGQTWQGMELVYTMANPIRIGGADEGWAIYNPMGILANVDRDGIESSFSGGVANIGSMLFNNPEWNGQKMSMTNTMRHQWTTEFGFSIPNEVLEGGKPRDKAYLYGLGKNSPDGPFYAVEAGPAGNPWTGGWLYGFPGVLEPGDTRYNQWIWGRNAGSNHYTFWSEFHNFAPRDSFSVDGVVMFVYPANPPFSLPPNVTSEIDNPEVQTQLQPMITNAQVAKIVHDGNYVLPETPNPPPMTIIPGDKEVTITWSDINLHTPDAYYAFLQANPALDPNHVYKEYDFEGYRLYRSYVGPSDAHSELIYQCSISSGNLAFYFKDTRDTDTKYYRMNNGMRIWYALVPYDNNFDPATGAAFSLPPASSGKTWNRPGTQLYTVEPRSNASNFKAADIEGEIKFIAADGSTAIAATNTVLSGDGSGALTEAPVQLVPLPFREVKFIPVNNERLTTAKTVYLVASDRIAYDEGCEGQRQNVENSLNLVDGSYTSTSVPLDGGAAARPVVTMQGAVDNDGLNYAIEFTFEGMDMSGAYEGVYLKANLGTYTGGSLDVLTARGCGPTTTPGTAPSNLLTTKAGRFQVTWKDAGGGNLTVEVKDLTRGVDLTHVDYPDEWGWGFQTKDVFGGDLIGNRGTYYNEAFVDKLPKNQRTAKMASTISADNIEQFGLFLNGILWIGHHEMGDGITMPAAGTVWTIDNAYGYWNDDMTKFTQIPDMAHVGDKWEIKIKPSTMNTEDGDLSKVMVVPNPYMASSFLDLSPDSRRIDFVNLPDRCTIRIYSLGGHLVNVLNHIGANRHGWGNYTDWDRLDSHGNPKELTGYDNHGGNESWNLRNRFGQTVASGLYFFHVTDSRGKTSTGKFYIID
ncbi:hypothetical protein LLH00_18835 [bacterium]|nr:hypothetical protein [bacterium]